MKPRQYIGVTGITTLDDAENMNESLEGYFGMYGILMSRKRLSENKYDGRWADIRDIPDLMRNMPENSLRTIHWCDNEFRPDLLEKVMNISKGLCNAVQLNIAYPSPELLKQFKEKNPEVKIIYQIERCTFKDPRIMAQELEKYAPLVDYAIIDASGGEGIPIDKEVSRNIAVELEKLDLGIVFAGGLTAQKVIEISDLIKEFNASIDAEGRLMNEERKLDNTKVKEYIKAGIEVMHGGKK